MKKSDETAKDDIGVTACNISKNYKALRCLQSTQWESYNLKETRKSIPLFNVGTKEEC